MNQFDNQQHKILELVHQAIQRDQELRDQYNIGEKFRFIKDRLHALLTHVEENISAYDVIVNPDKKEIADDEKLVYVYLYNAQGNLLKSWSKMLNPKAFYEYSVNRPIYQEKAHIEAFIKNKPNKLYHAYLTVAVKTAHILSASENESMKDIFDHPLVKIKEGALSFNKLIALTHNDQEYELNDEGELIKKSEE